jgi:glycerophosphoryl diester phosphodiesterase
MPLAIAHRGDPHVARENTMASFDSAVTAGADMLELDLHRTRDGAIVVVHDATLERLWGVNRALADMDLAEVRAEPGSQHRWRNRGASGSSAGHGIPTLEDVLERIATPLMIDFTTEDVVEGAVAVVRRAARMDRDLFVSGNIGALRQLRAQAPEARIGLTWVRRELPDPALLTELGAEFWNPMYKLVRPENVAFMHDLGLKVSTWTVDLKFEMITTAEAGVDAIVSNRIDRLRRCLASGAVGRPWRGRGQYPPKGPGQSPETGTSPET